MSDDDSGPNEGSMNWILSAFELTDSVNRLMPFATQGLLEEGE